MSKSAVRDQRIQKAIEKHINKEEKKRNPRAKLVSEAFDYAIKLHAQMELPEFIEARIKLMIIELNKKKKLRKTNMEAMGAVSIYLTCKEYNIARDIKEIKYYLDPNVAEKFNRCLKTANKFLATAKNSTSTSSTPLAVQFLDRWCSRGGYDYKIAVLSKDIALNAYKNGFLASAKPNTLASAALFMGSRIYGEMSTFNDIQKISHTGISTIQKAYDTLFSNRKYIIDKKIMEDNNIKAKQLANLQPSRYM
jgi:transcription initiation factor TFIIIB Brf1 subunit/transcription initiation factor TFIIB